MCSMADNRDHLVARFFQRLRALGPSSVLDVGCGRGGLLEQCRDAGITAAGVEADRDAVAQLSHEGFTVHEAHAAALPGDDRGYGWVVLRHVLHHLPDVATALDEACRVAETGVLVAEPWFDERIPSQSLALRLDRWIKRQHQRLGQVHEDCLHANQILALLPLDQDFEIDFEYYLRLRERALHELEAEAAPLLEGLPDDDPERAEYQALHTEAHQNGVTYGGTMILCLRRRPAPSA